MKYFAGLVIFNIFLCVQCYDLKKVGWLKTYERFVTEECTHIGLQLILNDNGTWREPTYEIEERLIVPGGFCPKKWQKKWDDVKLAINHELYLDYWFKWPHNILHIQLESTMTDPSEYDLVLIALKETIKLIKKEFMVEEEKNCWHNLPVFLSPYPLFLIPK